MSETTGSSIAPLVAAFVFGLLLGIIALGSCAESYARAACRKAGYGDAQWTVEGTECITTTKITPGAVTR